MEPHPGALPALGAWPELEAAAEAVAAEPQPPAPPVVLLRREAPAVLAEAAAAPEAGERTLVAAVSAAACCALHAGLAGGGGAGAPGAGGEDDAQPREPLTPLGAVVSAGVDMRGNGLRAGPRDRGCFVYALGKGARRPDVLVLCQHAVAEAGAAAWAAAVLDAFPCGRLVVLDALLAADVGAPRPGGPGREGAEPGQAFQWAAGAPFGEGAEAVVCPALPDAAALQRLSPAAQALMEGAAARGTPAQLLASVQGLPAPGVADVAAAGAHFQRHLAQPLGLALDVERAVERCGFVQEAYDSDVAVSTFV